MRALFWRRSERKNNVESNVEDQNTTAASTESAAGAEAAPVRRRASRRVSAAAGTPAAAETAAAETAAAPAAEAPAAKAPAKAAAAPAEAAAEAPAAEAAPKKRATRSRKKVEESAADATAPAAETPAAAAAPAEQADAAEATAPKKRAPRTRKKADAAPAADSAATEAPAEVAPKADTEAATSAAGETAEPAAEPVKRGRGRRAKSAEAAPAESTEAAAAPAAEKAAEGADAPETPAAENENASANAAKSADAENGSRNGNGNRNRRGRGQKQENADSVEQTEQPAEADDSAQGRAQSQNGEKNNSGNGPAKNQADNASRSSRTRQRDRKRRGGGDDLEPEITEDDVLLPIAGILDVLDNYAFVRTSGYLPGTSDVYVSLGQVKKYGLRRGDAVVGAIRQPREGEGGNRQKYNAIVKIDSINGRVTEEGEERIDAADLTAVFPESRLRLELAADRFLGRSIDLVAPIGFGQRGLIVLPANTDGAPIVTELAAAVSANAPEAHLMVVLADAQPEEVTHLQRTVHGEVVAATFDRPAEDQATVAELAIERAKRMLELGHDVVVLVDSLNRFARAYAQAQHTPTRPAHDELDEFALGQIKKLLASARKVENGGSLTVLATVEHGTDIEADEMLLREVRRVVNSEIRIAKTHAGIDPILNLKKSRTSNADAMLSADEAQVLRTVRAELAEDGAAKRLFERFRSTVTNAALLAEIQRAGGLS